MNRFPFVLSATVCLAACASTGDRVGGSTTLVTGSEDYTGPRTAAVTLVADSRPGKAPSDARLRSGIQRSIQQQLDASGLFAGVVVLERPNEANEAEVIIEPVLIAPPVRASEDLELRIRVSEKTNRRIVLDKHYHSRGRRSSLNLAELEEDLARRYGP